MGAAQEAFEIRLRAILQLFSITFFYYDYALTLDREIALIWQRRKTQSSWWYLGNRYLAVFGNAAVLAFSYIGQTADGCEHIRLFEIWTLVRQILLVANQVLGCILLTLRTYALYTRDKRILAFMLTSMAGLFGVAVWSLTGQKHEPVQTTGCHRAMSKQTARNLAVPWICLFAYDSVIFIMTITKTYRMRYRDRAFRSLPLVKIVVRDGAAYFAIMALSTLANILTFYMAGPLARGSLSTFAGSMSVTTMCRLMLNLHGRAETGIHTTEYAISPHQQCTHGQGRTTGFRPYAQFTTDRKSVV